MPRYRSYIFTVVICFMAGTIYGLYAYQHHLYPSAAFRMLTVEKTPEQSKNRNRAKTSEEGKWHTRIDTPVSRDQTRTFEGLGYLTGYETAPGTSGTVVYDTNTSYRGLKLYVSGHGPEAILTDMRGQPLHRWKIP
ncbi:MAG: hypothetical protein ABEK50_00535 [bacterium]